MELFGDLQGLKRDKKQKLRGVNLNSAFGSRREELKPLASEAPSQLKRASIRPQNVDSLNSP